MNKTLQKFDNRLLKIARPMAGPVARLALFVVFFWFGLLKVLMLSPAFGLVAELQDKVLPFFGNEIFVVILGLVEMLIGLGFLFQRYTRVVILLLFLHMLTTFLPLIFLPETSWQAFMVPTLEGQYIMKNIVLLALALQIGINLKPMKQPAFKKIFR